MGEPSLLVGNHSGGLLIADTFVFSAAFYDHFGPDRRFHQLAHDVAAKSPLLGLIRRYGVVPASHDNARAAFDLGAPVLVYPGGDYETFRPSWHGDKIEFGGRQGFVRLALERDVPIVPVVAIGGQETALFVTRGQRAAKLIGLDKLTRIKVLPVSIGPPLGINLLDFPGRIPLPAKIKIQRAAADRPARALRRGPGPRRGLRGDHRRDAGRAQRAGRGADAARRRLIAGIPMWAAIPSTTSASSGWKAASQGESSAAPGSIAWIVKTTMKAIDIRIDLRSRGPMIAAMRIRIEAVCRIQPTLLCASKLSAPKTPTPARKNWTTSPAVMIRAIQW